MDSRARETFSSTSFGTGVDLATGNALSHIILIGGPGRIIIEGKVNGDFNFFGCVLRDGELGGLNALEELCPFCGLARVPGRQVPTEGHEDGSEAQGYRERDLKQGGPSYVRACA